MTLISVAFSQTTPGSYPSLAPTFLTYMDMQTGATFTPPGITQLAFTGIYMFYHSTTTPFYFLIDGITTTSSSERYVFGVLGSIQQVDIQISNLSSTLAAYNSTAIAYSTTITALSVSAAAISTTLQGIGLTLQDLVALNTSLVSDVSVRIGTTASSFGTTAIDPSSLFGYAKRNQEVLEGDQTFNKVTGAWDIQTRGGTLLTQKTLSQTSSSVTKS